MQISPINSSIWKYQFPLVPKYLAHVEHFAKYFQFFGTCETAFSCVKNAPHPIMIMIIIMIIKISIMISIMIIIMIFSIMLIAMWECVLHLLCQECTPPPYRRHLIAKTHWMQKLEILDCRTVFSRHLLFSIIDLNLHTKVFYSEHVSETNKPLMMFGNFLPTLDTSLLLKSCQTNLFSLIAS